MKSKLIRYLAPIGIAILATLPGIFIRLYSAVYQGAPVFEHGRALLVPGKSYPLAQMLTFADGGQHAFIVAVLSGLAVLGASFLLLWACDAVQEDISQTLALAIVALIAVLPEYAVDMYITWQAGTRPEYAHYAIANMTGANRLIIGAAWLVIVGIYWFKTRRAVRIEKDRRTELFFLGIATLYAFFIAIKGTLHWYDGVVFIAMYVWYIRVAGKRPTVESEVEGPAEYLVSLPKQKRRLATFGLFAIAAGAIALNAEQFSEGLLATGAVLHLNKATLIQWLAPIASEAPEFTVAIMFSLRKRAGLALGSLLSANLNQWTLLVGMIPWVYGIAHGSFSHPIPMDHRQMNEIMLTAAQSLLGIVMLSRLRLSIGQVLLLAGLFAGQLILPPLVENHPAWAPFGLRAAQIHPLFSLIYVITAIALLLEKPTRLNGLWQGTKVDTFCEIPKEGVQADDELPEVEPCVEEAESVARR